MPTSAILLLLATAMAAPDAPPDPPVLGATAAQIPPPPTLPTRLPLPRFLLEDGMGEARFAELCAELGLGAPADGSCHGEADRPPLSDGELAGWTVTDLDRYEDRISQVRLIRSAAAPPAETTEALIRSLGHTNLRDCPEEGHGTCLDQHRRAPEPVAGERTRCSARAVYEKERSGQHIDWVFIGRGCKAPHRLGLVMRTRPALDLNFHY